MPVVSIEVRRPYGAAEAEALMQSVHSALVEVFRIPIRDRNVRLIEHEPHRFQVSPRLTDPEFLTFITIDCFAGRSLDAKRALYAAIVRNVSALGIPADHITILLRESALENWGIRDGKAACDVELGFEVRV